MSGNISLVPATLRVPAHAELGEGPTWDGRRQELLWVDIIGRRVHRFRPADGLREIVIETVEDVGAVVPRASGGFALAVGREFVLLEEHATGVPVTLPLGDTRSNIRLNDGKCDPAGRFWAGTVAYDAAVGLGSLYRLDADHKVTSVLSDVTCSNGLGWSLDGRTMYYIDTPTRGIDAFDFDLATGAITRRRRLLDIPKEAGVPDGMTVDADGGLWVALWGGGAVRRYLPDGTLDRIVEVPCQLVTSCAFGGPGLDELFITTARVGLNEAELANEPDAGGLFSCQPGELGQPEVPFAG